MLALVFFCSPSFFLRVHQLDHSFNDAIMIFLAVWDFGNCMFHTYSCKLQATSDKVCLIHFREYLVDLVGRPGFLCEPDSLLNGPSSISISSPLRFPRIKSTESTVDFRQLAKQYFLDCQSLNLVFDDASTGKYFKKKLYKLHKSIFL